MSDIKLKLESKGVNLASISEEAEREFQKAIKGLVMSTYDDIVQLAQDNLFSSQLDYIKSLQFNDYGNLYVISITEPGYYFEEGFPGYDIKPGILRGPKAKTSKEGYKYNIIPFQHKPTSKIKSSRIADDYYSQIQQTVKTMEKITPRTIYDRSGREVGQIIAKARKDIEGYGAGMIKVQKQYNNVKQSTHMTFRVVSEKSSDPNSWLHPGWEGLKAFDIAEKMIDDRINQIIQVVFGV